MTGYASYIGRVGALAVALGVGAAVAGGHGFAWADTTGSAASDASITSSPSGGDTAVGGGAPITAVDDSVRTRAPSAAAPKKPKKAPPTVVISNSGGAHNTSRLDRHAADQTPPADGQVTTDASAWQPNTPAQPRADAAPDTAPSAPDTLAKTGPGQHLPCRRRRAAPTTVEPAAEQARCVEEQHSRVDLSGSGDTPGARGRCPTGHRYP